MCGRSTSRPICLGTRNRRPLLWKRSDNVAARFTSMLALKYMWAKQPTTLSKWANTLAKRLAKRHEKNNLLSGFILLDQSSILRQSAVDNLAFYSSRLEKYVKPVSVYPTPRGSSREKRAFGLAFKFCSSSLKWLTFYHRDNKLKYRKAKGIVMMSKYFSACEISWLRLSLVLFEGKFFLSC